MMSVTLLLTILCWCWLADDRATICLALPGIAGLELMSPQSLSLHRISPSRDLAREADRQISLADKDSNIFTAARVPGLQPPTISTFYFSL